MKRIVFKQKIGLILFGLVLCVIVFEIGLRIGGGVILFLQEQKNKSALKEKNSYRILCLGESTTARGGINSWPNQLEEVLNKKNRGIEFNVFNKGVEGIDTAVIVLQLEENLDRYDPDMVIVMMGVNDWVGTIPYEDNLRIKFVLFIQNFRVYKLARLLYVHIDHTFKKYFTKKKTKAIEHKSLEKIVFNEEGECFENSIKAIYVQGRHEELDKIEEIFKDILARNPNDVYFYTKVGIFYKIIKRINEAEEMFKKALSINPRNANIYVEFGDLYMDVERFEESEKFAKKSLEVNPQYEPAYTLLGMKYRRRGEFEKIHLLAEKIIKEEVKNDRLYGFVATSCIKQGKYKEAENHYKKANEFRLNYYNPMTRHNYKKLREIVTQRGIKLLCVQYPMRSVEPLKKLFGSTEGIFFVNNERIFKEALNQSSYDDYFEDNFGGDFGHCTLLGNRMLAENIVNVIIKQVFNK